ncbi:MAG: ABC transporter permease [Chloroflexi bacterium]|nr:ABC transporter permease [Chloroflexota bacterium]
MQGLAERAIKPVSLELPRPRPGLSRFVSPCWCKVLRDLWGNKLRTFLVVLSIAVGVFAVGTVTQTFTIISQELALSYPQANPASATLYTDAFDDNLVQTIRRLPGVGDVEARSTVVVRVRIGADEWKSLWLYAIPDFTDIRINKVIPQGAYAANSEFQAERGNWPPPDRAVVLERSSLLIPGFVPPDARVGRTIEIELSAGGERRELVLAGLAHESTQLPAPFINSAFGYITPGTFEWLTGSRRSDTLHIIVAENRLDQAHITRIADQVRNKIESSGRTVYATEIPTPGKHPLQDLFVGMLLILNLLGFMSLFLSGFLVINTISGLLAQQVRQIGMMKAIGARTHQIAAMYLLMVFLFGVLALGIAIPASTFVARETTLYLASFVNVDFSDFDISPAVLAIEIGIGLLVPLVAAIIPVWNGTHLTIREAINEYGLGKGAVGAGRLDRVLAHVRGLSRPMRISFRNTFRRQARLILTLLTLVLSGTIFVSVLNVHVSMLATLEEALGYWQFDVLIPFAHPYRIDAIEQVTARVPGIVKAESWGFDTVRRLRADDSESDAITLFAPTAQTAMLQPNVTQGRWLLPEDENAIVVSTDVVKAEPDLQVGDALVLKIRGRETTWRIVGIMPVLGRFGAGIGNVYVNYDHYARIVGQVGRAASVQVVTDRHDTAYQIEIKKALEESYRQAGMRVGGGGITSGQIREQNELFFNIIVALLLVMASLMALVGGLGLMGTMSLNVLERTREIGVMRAIGASNGAIRRIIMAEGIFVGMLSGVIAILISIPLGNLLSDAVGLAVLQLALQYTISTTGMGLWLILVMGLSAASSFLPAYSASRLTVREVLVYE